MTGRRRHGSLLQKREGQLGRKEKLLGTENSIHGVMGAAPGGVGQVKAGSASLSAQAARTQHQGPDAHFSHSGGCSTGSGAARWALGEGLPLACRGHLLTMPARGGGRGLCFFLSPRALASAWGSTQRPSHLPTATPPGTQRHTASWLRSQRLGPGAGVHPQQLRFAPARVPSAPHRQSQHVYIVTRHSEGI